MLIFHAMSELWHRRAIDLKSPLDHPLLSPTRFPGDQKVPFTSSELLSKPDWLAGCLYCLLYLDAAFVSLTDCLTHWWSENCIVFCLTPFLCHAMPCHAFSSRACSRNKTPKERNLPGRSREIEFAGVFKRHSAALGDHRVRADEVFPLRWPLIATLTTPLDLSSLFFHTSCCVTPWIEYWMLLSTSLCPPPHEQYHLLPLSICTAPLGMPELKLGLNDKLMFEATGRSQSRLDSPSKNYRYETLSAHMVTISFPLFHFTFSIRFMPFLIFAWTLARVCTGLNQWS